MKFFLVVGFLFFSVSSLASESIIERKNELCSSEEQTIFFCKGKKKIAGICASRNISNLTGFAQYRVFNIDKNKIEFVFPQKLTPPERNFIISSHPLPGGIDVQIKFSNNGFLYVIHERDARLNGEGFEGRSEILVERDGRAVGSIYCLNDDSEVQRVAYESFFRKD